MICRRERWLTDRRFSRPLERGDRAGAPRLRVSGQAAGAGTDHFQSAANIALGRGRPRAHGSAQGRREDHPSQAEMSPAQCRRHPLGRVRFGTGVVPYNPRFAAQAQGRLLWRAKRLRFGRHRVAALPHHCRPQGFPRPPCPSPGNRTRGGGRRHGASDTPRQRER